MRFYKHLLERFSKVIKWPHRGYYFLETNFLLLYIFIMTEVTTFTMTTVNRKLKSRELNSTYATNLLRTSSSVSKSVVYNILTDKKHFLCISDLHILWTLLKVFVRQAYFLVLYYFMSRTLLIHAFLSVNRSKWYSNGILS